MTRPEAMHQVIREWDFPSQEQLRPIASHYEGLALLQQKVQQLQSAVFNHDNEAAEKSAVQLAAMTLRYLTDLCTSIQEISIPASLSPIGKPDFLLITLKQNSNGQEEDTFRPTASSSF
jgi:hypothetical protein